jgi:hypothetical protein
MRTILLILGIWLLINVLFVVVVVSPRRPRPPTRPSEGSTFPAPIDQNARRFEDDEPRLLRHVIISVAMGFLFVLAPPLIEAWDAINRRFKRHRDQDDAS